MKDPVRTALRSDDSGQAGVYVAAGVLLVIPFIALLWVGSYAKATPRLLGFPYFYWYQLAWVFIAAALTFIAYLLVSREDARRRAERRAGRR